MWEDPIVNEVRETRARLLESCGGDLHKLAERLRENQAKQPTLIVGQADLPRRSLISNPSYSTDY